MCPSPPSLREQPLWKKERVRGGKGLFIPEKTAWGEAAPILGLAFKVSTELKSPRSRGLCMWQSSRDKAIYWVKVQQLEQKPWRIKPNPLPFLGIHVLEMVLFIWTLLRGVHQLEGALPPSSNLSSAKIIYS